MKNFIIGIILIVLLILGITWVIGRGTMRTDVATTTPPTSDMSEQQVGIFGNSGTWSETVTGPLGDDWYLTLRYPNEIEANEPQSDIYTLKYIGPNNDANTEITDGFTLTIRAVPDMTAEEYVADQEVVDGPDNTTFKGRNALAYTTHAAIGGVTVVHQAFTLQDANAQTVTVDVSYNVSGDAASSYRDVINSILDTSTYTLADDEANNTMTVQLAMLDYEGTSDGESRGCDHVVYVDRQIEDTTTPLNASLSLLFSLNEDMVGGWHNWLPRTTDTLSFDHAELTSDGTAKIYLTGELSGLAGVCDNPRAKIQIEETALSFDTVSGVELYLNGEPTELQPSGRGD